MKPLENDPAINDHRTAMMNFLNEFGLEAPAILSLARNAKPVSLDPKEAVLVQGEHFDHIYFLVKGSIRITLKSHDREDVLGEAGPVTMLGEISFFNGTPATASVEVTKEAPAVFLRLSYDEFRDIIEEYPQIKPTLSRIGDMRVISQKDGFASFTFFMDMIGWKRDRLTINRAVFPLLEDTIVHTLLPRIDVQDRILDVGDGPGMVCEIILQHRPSWEENLFIQATHLEDAILNPMQAFPSDLSRAQYLRERFQVISALQIFEHQTPEKTGEQFELAAKLLEKEGLLLVMRLRVVDVALGEGKTESTLLFNELTNLVEKKWPGALGGEDLVKVTFEDADFDPSMEWSQRFCDLVTEKKFQLSKGDNSVESTLLEALLEQARLRVFDPDEIHFHWLHWHAANNDFVMESSLQKPELGFFYQLYRRGPDSNGK